MKIDINADIGESYGLYKVGNDRAIVPYLTSCNIACGFHGGDPLCIERTINLALKYNLRIGAHPSYPDRVNFGRKKMQLPKEELRAILKYQIAALKGMVESQGGTLVYVKPHGALYNTAASDHQECQTIIDAIKAIDPNLQLMGLAGSEMQTMAAENHLSFIAEAFADRRYTIKGTLLSRKERGAVLHEPSDAVEQVLAIVLNQNVRTNQNAIISLQAESICIHGDNPAAIDILQALHKTFIDKKIRCGY